jgi:glycosidase
MMKLYDNFTNDFLYPNPNNILIFAENHDTNRINETYGNDIRKYKMAMTVLATMRGIPQLYYGSEIGMAGNKDKEMQLFVKIFQAVGMAMQTMHLQRRTNCNPKRIL